MKFLAVTSIAALFVAQQVAAYPFIEGCLQNHTITTADSCVSVAAQYQISEADFYAMNPGLHHSVQHNCDNLDTGKNYCVCLKAPCPVPNAAVVSPAASAVNNTTAPTTAAVSSSINPLSTSATPLSSSAVPTSSAASSSITSSTSASTTPTNTPAGKNSASVSTTITAITIGIVMTATTMLL